MSAWDKLKKEAVRLFPGNGYAGYMVYRCSDVDAARAEDAEQARQAQADAFIAGFSAGLCSTRGPIADYHTWQKSKREL